METSQSTSTVSEEYHKAKLEEFCRLCQLPVALAGLRKEKCSISQFQTVFMKVFNIDISQDKEDVHPKILCNKCRVKCSYYKRKVHARKSINTISIISKFTGHTSDCYTCNFTVRRSPRKTPSKHKLSSSTLGDLAPKKARVSLAYEDVGRPKDKVVAEILLTSIPTEDFEETSLAEALRCNICYGVPANPVSTDCGHIYCKTCLDVWLGVAKICNKCKTPIEEVDATDLNFFHNTVYDVLHLKCQYSSLGCKTICTIREKSMHEEICKYGKYPAAILREASTQRRGPSLRKIPLAEADRQYVKRKRLKPLISYLDNFCDSQFESKIDILYFLLHNELSITGDGKKAEVVWSLWQKGKMTELLTPKECLALRVDTLQSKSQYKKQHDYFKSINQVKFCAPKALDKVEEEFMPYSVKYEIIDKDTTCTMYDNLTKCPLDIMQSFNFGLPDIPIPNCKGVRWHYPDALARTLQEIDPIIEENLMKHSIKNQDIVIKTTIKDGGDGMGEVAVHKEKGDRRLPDKVLRFSFCVLQCVITLNDKEIIIFQEESPNSVKSNRPLLEAIADENNHASTAVCMNPIEREREHLKDKTLNIYISDTKRRQHQLSFITSMVDEKYDRALGGLAGSGSSYICTLCHATKDTAKTHVGTFHITRTQEETTNLATYLHINPDKLSDTQMNKIIKGVKVLPVLLSQPRERMLDATHADINMARFFKKLIIRCMARIWQWDMTTAIKSDLENAEHQFDTVVKKNIGSNPALMMPGNYARTLFDKNNEKHILALVQDEQRKELVEILDKFRFMREVYRSKNPDPIKVSNYKKVAVEFGNIFLKHFDFCRWPNYMHKLIEHVQELIQDPTGPGSIGAVSGEGNEAGNKIFRFCRLNLSCKGNTQQGLRDTLRFHWLYSSPELKALAVVSHRKNKCGICQREGHNQLTCPEKML